MGSQHAQQALILTAALSGLLVLSTSAPEEASARRFQFAGTAGIIAAAAIAGLLSRSVHPVPGIFVAYGRYTASRVGQADIIYMACSEPKLLQLGYAFEQATKKRVPPLER